MIGQFLVMMLLAASLSVATALLLFPHELSFMAPLFEASGEDFAGESISFLNMIMDIVPSNLVDPFKGGNLMQILFLAIFFGVVLNKLGEKANIAREIIEFMNGFCMKMISFAPIPMASCSSIGSLPDTINLATKKLGIAPGLASFALPVGIQLHQFGTCFYLAMPTVMMARVVGVPVNMEFILYLIIYVFIFSYTMPTVPGVGMICLGTVFAAMGIPPTAVMFFLCIEFLTDMLDTTSNVSSNVADVLLLAKKTNMLDEEEYLKS